MHFNYLPYSGIQFVGAKDKKKAEQNIGGRGPAVTECLEEASLFWVE